jgi:hypothetical protein
MSKSAKKRTSVAKEAPIPRARPSQQVASGLKTKKDSAGSKQFQVIAMLQSSAGATIAAMMKITGWQQHSVRGFLAGVVSKRLKLKLRSDKVDGMRVYRIAGGGSKARVRQSKHSSS